MIYRLRPVDSQSPWSVLRLGHQEPKFYRRLLLFVVLRNKLAFKWSKQKEKEEVCIEVGGLCTELGLRTHLRILTDRNQFDWLDLCISTGGGGAAWNGINKFETWRHTVGSIKREQQVTIKWFYRILVDKYDVLFLSTSSSGLFWPLLTGSLTW